MHSANNPRIYSKVVQTSGLPPRLAVEVFTNVSPKPTMYLYSIALMDITWPEIQLKAGRFINYVDGCFPYQCARPVDPQHLPLVTMEADVDWIHQHVTGKWGFEISMEHVGKGEITFSFENIKEAIHFRLAH